MSPKSTTASNSSRPSPLFGLRGEPVIWHDCKSCGLPWPFPLGLKDSRGIADREWKCTVCCNTELAALKRKLQKLNLQIADPLLDMDA